VLFAKLSQALSFPNIAGTSGGLASLSPLY